MTAEALSVKKTPGARVERTKTIPLEGPRPHVEGKFLFCGRRKLYIRGVTYGPFKAAEGGEYKTPADVERDFAKMSENGINAVRTYTLPPKWLLDIAARHGLRVMVGLAWEQHILFLDDAERVRSIEAKIVQGVRQCGQHPALLCFAIGNEIPPPLVRWYGRRRIERFLKRLYRLAKREDPAALVTYVNYPTTEYLQLGFADFMCFNVYLESRDKLAGYLARLQNLAGDKPLVMAEIGLDSRRNGEDEQARMLDWQIRTAFAEGCAGTFVFAWTDEWHRGGFDIDDWDFGLVRRDGSSKPALDVVRKAYIQAPYPYNLNWPKISVVVCSYNGSRTIRECCEGIVQLQYPNYEVIVVNDGSTDETPEIVSEFGFKLISTENRGLSSARNTGLEAATGEIVAYIDDDATPDPHWLMYLAAAFIEHPFAAVGGPNIPPLDDPPTADCVANAPGGPCHVLLSDRIAEHIPGCNMSFRREALLAIGGFDAKYRAAGDDVDVCWRIQRNGGTIGFSHAAMVWHHRRAQVKMYWKQQRGYGRAEAMLERKWPQKYNAYGHLFWAGSIYGKGLTFPLGMRRWRVYHGVWGSALFQRIYQSPPSTLLSVPLMPEWYFVLAALAAFSFVGAVWHPLFWVSMPLFALAAGATFAQAILSASHATFHTPRTSGWQRFRLYALTTFLHLMQPLARLWGRLSEGLTPWRRERNAGLRPPWAFSFSIWAEKWRSPIQRIQVIEALLQAQRCTVLRGNEYNRWDLEVWPGLFGGGRLFMAVEDHGGGKQMLRFRVWPRCQPVVLMLIGIFGFLAVSAAFDRAWAAVFVLGAYAALLSQRMILEMADVLALIHRTLDDYSKGFLVSEPEKKPSA